jgi:nucleoside-diphosphate-sugar epimerase
MKARIGNPVASPVLVTDGTGTLGRLVVARLRDAGRDVRALGRRSREDRQGIELVTGDLATDEGIDAAVEGAEIIVHSGKAAGAFRAGANLAPDRAVGRRIWEDFLAARVSSPRGSVAAE